MIFRGLQACWWYLTLSTESMAAGTSILQREVSLSALSISQPAVINSRPHSHRIQSAQLFISKGQHFEVDRAVITRGNRCPTIEKLDVSTVEGNKSLLHHRQEQLAKPSAFTNFRLFQRLVVSARARVSSIESKGDSQSHASSLKLESLQDGDSYQSHSHSQEVTHKTDNNLNVAKAPSGQSTNGSLAASKATERHTSKVKKARRQKSKKSVEQFKGGGNHQAAGTTRLRPTPTKVTHTFSKRFNRHRKTRSRNKESTEQDNNTLASRSGSDCFNTTSTVHEEARTSQPSLTSNDTITGLSCVRCNSNRESVQEARESVQEANLRAIYEPSGTPQSVPQPLKKLRLRKIFQSEPQSSSISECGRLLPCAPPTSPTPLILEKYEIVPSLADLRSQQSIKQRLRALEKDTKKKQNIKEKERRQQEMELLQRQMEEERIRTRQEIYALNKIMTRLERDHFKRFQEQMKIR